MTSLRTTLAIALTAATLSVGMFATTTTASAFGFHRGMHFHHSFHRWNSRVGFRYHFHYHYHYRFQHWAHRWGHPWRVGFHVHTYRPYVHTVHVGPAAPVCPAGTHLGYEGKYCWPNR